MLNMITVAGLLGMLVMGMTVYANLQLFSNTKTNSYLYTDLAVAALDDLYKTGKLNQEDFLVLRNAYAKDTGELG